MARVGIFWDYENCQYTAGRSGFHIARSIEQVAAMHGSVTVFNAYMDIQEHNLATMFRSELQSTGVNLVDCPHNGQKDVVDHMLQADMMAYALDNAAPATIILITGDRDFAYAVSLLRRRRYRVVLICHMQPGPHRSLSAQVDERVDWSTRILDLKAGAVVVRKQRAASTPSLSFTTSCTGDSEPQRTASSATCKDDQSTLSRRRASSIASSTSIDSLDELFYGTPPTSPTFELTEPMKDDHHTPLTITNINDFELWDLPPMDALLHAFRPDASPAHRSLTPPYMRRAMESLPTWTVGAPANAPTACEDLMRTTDQMETTTVSTAVPIPHPFQTLVHALRILEGMGVMRPRRTDLGCLLAISGKDVYAKAGVQRFRQYIAMAVDAQIVTTGGSETNAWVALSAGIGTALNNGSAVDARPSLHASLAGRLLPPLSAIITPPKLPLESLRLQAPRSPSSCHAGDGRCTPTPVACEHQFGHERPRCVYQGRRRMVRGIHGRSGNRWCSGVGRASRRVGSTRAGFHQTGLRRLARQQSVGYT